MARRTAFLFPLFLPRTYAINASLSLPSNLDVHALMLIAYHIFCFVYSRASSFLGASQRVRGERAESLGWEPRPVVLEDWADEGITSAVATLQ
jgi:hypothetical protein